MSIPNCKRVCLCLTLFIAQSTSLLVVDRQTKEKESSNNLPQGGQHIQNIACNSAINKEGLYQHEAQNSDVDCSLFIIGEADQLLEMSFDAFDVSCEGDGFLMIFTKQQVIMLFYISTESKDQGIKDRLIDGWLIEDEIFPSDNDFPHAGAAAGQRYREFCGVNSPRGIYVSSQNIFQLHFKVHGVNQGFRFSLRLRHNPQPCNMLLRAEQGSVTLRNYGQRINCSVFIISPASIQVNNINVSANRRLPQTSQGILWKCRSHQTRDYVEMLDGDGFDPTYMWRVGMLDVCASIMQPKLQWPQQFMLGCQRSAVRLVSSGNFFMSLNVTYHTLTDDELTMVHDLPC